MNVSHGSGFEGGHTEDKGLSGAGEVITVPNHRHNVEMEFVRYEFSAAYQIAESWDAWLRVPYEVKRRTANVSLIDAATEDEAASMQRNLNIHHPSATLEGLNDLMLLAAWKKAEMFRDGDTLALALGTSIPVGKTEEDPFVLGDAGLAHQHLQFGNGTFDPLLELYYRTPVSTKLSLSANLVGKFPLYENSKGYQGSLGLSSGLSLSYSASPRLNLRAGWSIAYQGYAHWQGERDVNSGLTTNGVVVGASYKLSDGVHMVFDMRAPISQESLSDDGDTFEEGPVVQLGISYSF